MSILPPAPKLAPDVQIIVDTLGALEGSLRLLHQLGRPVTHREIADAVRDVATTIAKAQDAPPTPESEHVRDPEPPAGAPRWRSCKCEGADEQCAECDGSGVAFY